MTSTRGQKDDDVIIVTEDDIVPTDEAPAGDRRAFAMPAAADERMAEDRMTGNRMAGQQVPDEQVPDEQVPDEQVPGETVPGDETAREEGLAASAARGPAPAAAAASASQPAGEAGGDPWPDIQARFVDDPRAAVERAAEVTTGALTALTAAARNREQSLRGGWQARDAGTEDLRTALRDYRELAQRLSGLAGQL